MGKKFTTIYESVLSRYSVGGYLCGDIIKFRPSFKNTVCFKSMNTVMQKELDELIKSGLNIRVVQVGDKLSGASAGNQHKTSDMVVITVAGDHGGGRYYSAITVSPDMIDLVDESDPSPSIPDQFVRKDNSTLKPEVYKTDTQNITRLTDKGNGKATPNKITESTSTQISKDNKNIADLMEII